MIDYETRIRQELAQAERDLFALQVLVATLQRILYPPQVVDDPQETNDDEA